MKLIHQKQRTFSPSNSSFRPGASFRKAQGQTVRVLLLLGLGVPFWQGCTVYVPQPAPVAVVPMPPPDEPPPVVVEESAVVEFVPPPVEVDYVFIGGRYCYWHPEYHRWFYRPYGWRPGYGLRVRRAADFRELNRFHAPEARPHPFVGHPAPGRPEPGRPEPGMEHARFAARPQEPVRKEQQKPAPKKEEKKRDDR